MAAEAYRFETVYRATTPALRAEAMAFWTAQRAIGDPAELERRAWQVACVMRNGADGIAGLSTVYMARLRLDAQLGTAPFYRHFIRPDARGGFGFVRLAALTCDALLAAGPDVPPLCVFVAENPKMMRAGLVRFLGGRGLRRLPTAEGRPHLWVYELRSDGPHRRYLPE